MQDFINPPPGSAPVAIYEDGGGLVTEYQRRALQYSLEKRKVEIHGSCRSACILALSVPDVCVTPSAVVKAHQAYEKYSQATRSDVTQQMLDALPPQIKGALEHNIQVNYTPSSTLTYAELRQLGVPACQRQKAKVKVINKSQETALGQLLKFFGRSSNFVNR